VAADYAVAESTINNLDESENFYGVPEVEIDWLFNFGNVGGRIDIQEDNWNAGSETIEQAFATYEFTTGNTLTAGRYASMLGYEDFERPGLHQYSYAYDIHNALANVAPGNVTSVGISPGYNQGLKYTYESNGNFFGVSFQDSVFSNDNAWAGSANRFGGDDIGTYGLEVAGALQIAEGLRWFLGGAYEDIDSVGAEKNYMLNTYIAYETGPLTLGAELNYGESEAGLFYWGFDEKCLQGLLVANYAYSDCSSVTGRISYSEHTDNFTNVNIQADFIKYSLAHKYAFSENLALINEVSYVDGDSNFGVDYDSLMGAASLLFTF